MVKLKPRSLTAWRTGVSVNEYRLLVFFVVGFVVTFGYFLFSLFDLQFYWADGENPTPLFNVTDNSGMVVSMNPLKKCYGDMEERVKRLKEFRAERLHAWTNVRPDYILKFYAFQGLFDPAKVREGELFRFRMNGYNHYFMDFYDKDAPCNVYSFGIDVDFSGLSHLWRRYPQCQVNIADSSIAFDGDSAPTMPYARLFRWALGGVNGSSDHHPQPLADWYRQNGRNRTIDLMIINIKGNEYSVLPQLANQVGRLPPICQFNVRIHFPPQRYASTAVDGIVAIWEFMLLHKVTMFNAESDPTGLQLFFVNLKPPECNRKFFC